MKANEFRLGNYVMEIHEKEPIQISLDEFHLLAIHEPAIENYKPIPLTEEWLIKFGFDVIDLMPPSSNVIAKHKESFIHLTLNSSKEWILDIDHFSEKGQFGLNKKCGRCKYVHQLQNLYFALTGSELEIKE